MTIGPGIFKFHCKIGLDVGRRLLRNGRMPLRILMLLLIVGFAWTQVIFGAIDRDKRSFTAEEKAQGYSNRTVLALPKEAVLAGNSLPQAESREQVRTLRHFPRFDGLRVIEVPAGERVDRYIKRLQATGLYAFVEEDRLLQAQALPSDPDFLSGAQWSLRNTGQSDGKPGADIQVMPAWDLVADASDAVVAVIDSGVRLDHPDLVPNLWRNPGESGNGRETNGIDDDGNGYIDDVFGINATVAPSSADSGKPADDDGTGHGTAVAGIIGAVGNNGLGMTGVAWKARIMVLKFLTSDGFGATSDGIECMDYAVAKGAKIINASYGSTTFSQAESAAMQRIKNAGIVLVAASGNDGLNNDEFPHYPANYAFENVVAVGASTRTDQPAPLSNYGSGKVDLFAPGVDIWTLTRIPDEPYAAVSGSSFAAPHVSGALALIRSLHPQDTPRQSINRLLGGVDHVDSFIGKAQSSGRLNVTRALTASPVPFNDLFASPALLAGRFVSVRTANTGATNEPGEPLHAGAPATHSLWWSWTAPESASITIDTAGSLLDTTLAVYTGDQLQNLVEVASNDNAGILSTSAVTFTAVQGKTYRIAVDARGGLEGMLLLNLRTPPANDSFQSPLDVAGMSFRITQSNVGATRQAEEPRVNNVPERLLGRSVWFRWTAPQNGSFQAAVFSDSVDTLLGVYQGQSVSALTLIAENDDGQDLLYDPLVTFQARQGETYYFAIDSYTQAGAFEFWLVDSAWQVLTVGSVDAPPAAGADGTIYYSSGEGILEAVKPSGVSAWLRPLSGAGTYSSPAVGPTGTIHVGDVSGMLTAFSPDGTKVWTRDVGDNLYASPAIGGDGTVFVRAESGDLFSLSAANDVKWTVPVAGESYTSPSVGVDGTIFIGSTDHKLYAFKPDKTLRWTFDAEDEIYASPAIDAAGVVYVGTLRGDFFAVNPDGSRKWVLNAGGGISSSAAIGADGTLYFGTYGGNLCAVGADGKIRWSTSVGTDIRTSSPAVDDQGVVYIGTLDGTLVAVNADGTIKRTYHFGGPVRSSPLLHDGMLYIGAQDYRLYAIRTGTGPAASPWPMFRKNAARTAAYAVSPPVLKVQPRSQRVLAGGSVVLGVQSDGTGPLTFQWARDGVPLPGATGATLTLNAVQAAQSGIYTVTVQNNLGEVTSDGAMVIIEASKPEVGTAVHLVNLSVRSVGGQAEQTLIVGFIVEGGPKTLLARAIGPSLGRFGVTGVVPDPSMDFIKNGQIVGRNDNWLGEDAPRFASVGAFALDNGSKDAAIVTPVLPGLYTARVNTAVSGVALVELYDMDGGITATGPRLVNVSARAEVGTGGNLLIAGFVVAGDGTKRILVRAVGPQLKRFGLTSVLEDPRLELYRDGAVIASNDNWSGDDGRARGAFPLDDGSKDAVLIMTLTPGSYTANVTGVGGTTGVALVEVYEW